MKMVPGLANKNCGGFGYLVGMRALRRGGCWVVPSSVRWDEGVVILDCWIGKCGREFGKQANRLAGGESAPRPPALDGNG